MGQIIKSYVSPKIEIKPSPIHGLGMFAKEKINKNEIVFIKGGFILRKSDVFSSNVINSYLPIDDEFIIGSIDIENEENIKLFNNHSCDPNCGVRGEITFVAMRNIHIGEELTIDYAMVDNEEYSFICNCQKKICRKVITGFDWKLPELQRNYPGHFSCYLEEKIKQIKNLKKDRNY